LLQEEEPGFFDVLHSVGVGVRIITPIGVLRFEYGAKINPGENESPDEFDFTISTLF
jgi:outer membrane protein assembly factor BamA